MSPHLNAGTGVGPYEIREFLGAGGMGEVYRAVDARLQRDVAIKILPPSVALDRDRVARFEREARATAALNHPHIVSIYDVGTAGELAYVVEELLSGQTLRGSLSNGPLPVRKSIDFARQIAEALAAAHDRRIVHRDLKPENVFVTDGGHVKVLDFGLAKLLAEDPPGGTFAATLSAQTGAGVLLGTVGYMAPEQARGLAADHRADIFALGAILYEMVSGTRAFRGATPADTIAAVLQADPPALVGVSGAVPSSLDAIVRRCLEKDPADRFQSARDVAFALEAIAPRSSETMSAAAPPRRMRPATARLAAALAAAAIAGAGAAWYAMAARTPTELPLSLSVVLPAGLELSGTPALAPDGRSVAFVASDASAVTRVYLRRLDNLEVRALPQTDGGDQPFWSPDGKSLAFFARGKLWRTDVNGGTPRIIADVVSSRGGTWNRDGVVVFAGNGDVGLSRVSAEGGPVTSLTTLDRANGEISHRWPRFLPDGRHVLFMNRVAEAGPTRYYVTAAALDGSPPRRLFEAGSTGVFQHGRLLFHRRGQLMSQPFDASTLALSGEATAVADRFWTDTGNVAGLVGFDAAADVIALRPPDERQPRVQWRDRSGAVLGDFRSFLGGSDVTISPDGATAAIAQASPRADTGSVVLLDLARGTQSAFGAQGIATASIALAPDGRVAYSPVRGATFDLYARALTPGASEALLLHTDGMKAARSWSPDGRYVLFNATDPRTKLDVWVLDLHDSHTARVFAGSADDEADGAFSPDGAFVAYVSTESGQPEIYVRPFVGNAAPVRVSVGGGDQPHWGRTARELFFVASDGRLMSVPLTIRAGTVTAEPPRPLFQLSLRHSPMQLQVSSDRVYAFDPKQDRFLAIEDVGESNAGVINLIFGRH